MRYRFYGDRLELVKYEIKLPGTDTDTEGEVLTAITEEERDEILERYPDGEAEETDNTGYEWLDGMEFTQEQLRRGELDKAVNMGETAYKELRDANDQKRINAMIMLEIAKIKAGAANE